MQTDSVRLLVFIALRAEDMVTKQSQAAEEWALNKFGQLLGFRIRAFSGLRA